MVMLEDPKVSWIRDRPCLYIYFEKTLGDAFELWCWRRLLRVPWTARRSNQSILKEISPGCPLEGLMLKLEVQYCGCLMRRADSFEKTLMLGKIEGRRRGDDRGRDGWMASPTQWTWVWVNSRSWWWTGRPGSSSPWGCKESDTTERLNWTELLLCDLKEREMNFTVHISICKYSRYKKLLDD